ncbi:hypothetical protein [Streptomyces niger]|uniref:hypothetical protein n=1 Tax=Streptomyces niger TaxID=66373 RepID=UPI00069B4C0B|nr:hypothetical protein [Streptomyces niger]
MTMGKTATSVLLAGALVGVLSGCSSSGGTTGGGGAHGGSVGTGGDVSLQSKLTAPAAFDAAKGWEVEADWLPQGQPLPYAVSGKSGVVAYLDKTARGYVLNVREASSGKLRSASKPWQGPKLTEEQSDEQSGKLAVPQIALIPGKDREYFAVWARGEARKDKLHEYKEVVSAAFYPADASGEDVSPAGAGIAEAPDGEFDRPSVFAGPGGLAVTSYGGDSIVVSPDGKVVDTSNAKVTLNGEAVDPDYLMSFPGPGGVATNGDEGGTGKGGFGVDGGWQSEKATPPGAARTLKYDPVIDVVKDEPNGRIVGGVGDHLIANWAKKEVPTSDDISAVHDLATGAVQATAPCDTEDTEYDADVPSPKNPADVQPAVSPNGRYLVKGGNIFDLKTGKGACTDKGEDAKKITLASVGDDGIAYGLAGEDTPRTPVAVSAATGAAEPLPEATTTPNALTKGAGVFATYAGTDTMRLIVLATKN